MYGLIIGIVVFVCVLLILVVLVQNPKGGGLASGFSSSNQFMGVKRTADFIEKTTWGLAAVLVVLSVLAPMLPRNGGVQQPKLKDQIENTIVPPDQAPSYPAAPADQPAAPAGQESQPQGE